MKVEVRVEPLRVVRANNMVPGVIFGKNFLPVSIQVDESELHKTLNEFGHSQTFKVKLGKATHTVYIKEIQRKVLLPDQYLNVKLQKVGKGDTIVSHIPLNIIGKELIEKRDVALHIISDNIEVEYAVGKGVSHIDLDVSNLKPGESICFKDIVLPKSFKCLNEEEDVVLSLNFVKIIEPEEEDEEEPVKEAEPDPTKVEAIKQKSE